MIKRSWVRTSCESEPLGLRRCLSGSYLRFLDCFAKDEIAVPRAGNCPFDHNDIRIAPNLDYFEILDGYLPVTHLACHLPTLEGTTGCGVVTDGTAMSEKLVCTVSARLAGKIVPFHNTGVALSDGDARYIDEIAGAEEVDGNLTACFVARQLVRIDPEFPQSLHGCHVGLFEVTHTGFCHLGYFGNLFKPELNRIVTVRFLCLFLNDDAWSGLYNCNRDNGTVLPEYLRHAELLPYKSDTHFAPPEATIIVKKSWKSRRLYIYGTLCYKFAMRVEWDGHVHEIDRKLTVQMLLDRFSLSKEAHLVTANGVLATEDRMLERDDDVTIIRVISGG